MRRGLRIADLKGFTLVELMIAVGVLGMLVALAVPTFQTFLKKAKAVEAQTALHEVERLQEHYYIDQAAYSNNLSAIGYAPTSPLKYYQITITLGGRMRGAGRGKNPYQYQVTASGNVDGDPDLDAWVLTKYADDTSDIQHGCIPRGRGRRVNFGCVD